MITVSPGGPGGIAGLDLAGVRDVRNEIDVRVRALIDELTPSGANQ